MRPLALAACAMGVLTLAACGAASAPASTSPTGTSALPVGGIVTLGATSFDQISVTISAGHALRFVDPGDAGGTHQLCLGTGGRCNADAQGPQALHGPGLMLRPGDTKDIDFPNAGLFELTCTIHPAMQLSISVLGSG